MNIAIWQKLDYLARSITPFGLSLILIVLSVLPTHIPGYMQVAPILVLISIYHWAIYRPNLLPIFAVFILGLLQDLLLGTPVGLYILVFIKTILLNISCKLIFKKRPVFKPFLTSRIKQKLKLVFNRSFGTLVYIPTV